LTSLKPENLFIVARCGARGRGALQPEHALEDVHLDHAHHRPAFFAAKFHVAAIDGGDDAATTLDAGGVVGDARHAAGEILADVAIHAPFVPQAPECDVTLWSPRLVGRARR